MERIKLDEKGVCVNGEYRILLASSLFYFRIPRERWEDRMRLLKAAGYNTIDVYFPWNYHEVEPGKWDFEGNRDVRKFLQLAAENELFVIARPGPYICSEWDGGAIPAWLWEKGIPVRQDDPDFLREIGRWYEHILPVLAEYQIGRQGTVICMQIENELDFYQCASPVSYMEKLKKKAESLGIVVPLFYCCGQNDLLRGGGLTPGLYTAFNVYTKGDYPQLEERAFHLNRSARERNMPFLVTETNREHDFLKRLLACGARLLSPYNQTAGSTMDFYNGITNWGTQENPIALMASDYDFHSMIGAAGEVNGQFRKARLLAGLLNSLGEELARAQSCRAEEMKTQSGGKVNTLIPQLCLSRGRLAEISNLGERGEVRLTAGQTELMLEMGALETRLLPFDFRLSADCVLRYANFEIGWIEETETGVRAGLYGEGDLVCGLDGTEGIREIRVEADRLADGETVCFSYGNVEFLVGTEEKMADGHIPGLPDTVRPLSSQKGEGHIRSMERGSCKLACPKERETEIAPMETLGQYRGTGCYRVMLPEDGEYLMTGAADLVTWVNGEKTETVYVNGGCLVRKLQKGELRLFTEIWGHSNFDDIRCASLRMGSLKGVEKLVRISRRQDLTESWMMDLDENEWKDTCFFRHSPYNTISGIDGYNRAVSPLKTIYSRSIESGAEEDALFLHFSEADCMIGVYVNNRFAGMVQKDNPYVDLSRFAGSGRMELSVRIIRRYYTDRAGEVTLIGGRRIRDCRYGEAEPVPSGKKADCAFPFAMEKGENSWLYLSLEESGAVDRKLILKGKDMKLTVYAGGHAAGRILLQDENMPVVAGGRRDVVTLCSEWTKDIRIWCQATGEHPVLESIRVEDYVPVIGRNSGGKKEQTGNGEK